MKTTLRKLTTTANPSAMNKHVTIGGLTGVLVGVIPVADRCSLALVVGGSRVWTDAYDLDEALEVHS